MHKLCFEGCFLGMREEDPMGPWPLWREKEKVALGYWGLPFHHSWPLWGEHAFPPSFPSDEVTSVEGWGAKQRLLGGKWIRLTWHSEPWGWVRAVGRQRTGGAGGDRLSEKYRYMAFCSLSGKTCLCSFQLFFSSPPVWAFVVRGNIFLKYMGEDTKIIRELCEPVLRFTMEFSLSWFTPYQISPLLDHVQRLFKECSCSFWMCSYSNWGLLCS